MKIIFAISLLLAFNFSPNLFTAPKIKIDETYDEFDGVGIRRFRMLDCRYLPLRSVRTHFRTSNEFPFIYLTFLSYNNFEYHETVEVRFKDDPDKEIFTITAKDYETEYVRRANQYLNDKYYTYLTYYDSNMVFKKIVDKYSQLAQGKKNKDKIEIIYRTRSRDNTILFSGEGGCSMRADRARLLKEIYDDSLKFMQEN